MVSRAIVSSDAAPVSMALPHQAPLLSPPSATIPHQALISFGSAVEDGDLHRACAMLERLDLTPETEAM